MNIKLYRFMFFMLVASFIVPVLVYSSQQRDSAEIKPNYVNESSVGTEVKTESKNRQEMFVNGKLSRDNLSTTTAAKPKINKSASSTKPKINKSASPTKPKINKSTGLTKPKINESASPTKPKLKKSSSHTKPRKKQARKVIKKTAKAKVTSLKKKLVTIRPIVVDLPEMDEQLDKPPVSPKLDENVDDLLLGDKELDEFRKLASEDDGQPPGHRVVPSEKEKISIVPITATKEEGMFLDFPTWASYFPDVLIKVMPFNIEDLGAVKPTISPHQAPVEPQWFKPILPKPNNGSFKLNHPPPNFNYEKDASWVGARPLDIYPEKLFNFPPIFGSVFAPKPSLWPIYWPKILGPYPISGKHPRKSKNRTTIKIKPEVQNMLADAHLTLDRVIPIARNISLGANCRYSSECTSRCCLRYTAKKKKFQRCHQRSRKGQLCVIGQILFEVYVGYCPCLAGDAHCKSVRGSKEVCDA